MKYSKYINSINEKLSGKTIVITGASSGLGLEVVKAVAPAKAHVVIGVRNTEKMAAELAKLNPNKTNCKFEVLKLDLTDTDSIAAFADSVKEVAEDGIDAVINNAGIFARKKELLPNGHEVHFFTNCMAPIILSKTLLPELSKRPGSKIVFVSSVSIGDAKVDFDDMERAAEKNDIKTYANSKRWLTYYALELKRCLSNDDVCVEIVHPGISGTSLLHYSHSKLGKFGFAIVKAGMSVLFPSPKKACLSEIAAMVAATKENEWTCPAGPWSVYGYPKAKQMKLKLESPDIQQSCFDILNDEIAKL